MAHRESTNNHAPWVSEDLTDEETADAINEAKRKKYYRTAEQREMKRREAYRAELLRPWSADEYLQFIKYRAIHHLKMSYRIPGNAKVDGLQMDVDNAILIKNLCMYFTNDPAFEAMVMSTDKQGNEYKGDLKKGILLFGPPGTGKSAIMKLFAINQRACYSLYNVPKICDDYQRDGPIVIEAMSELVDEPEDDRYFYQRKRGHCFDDLLREGFNKKHYGNEANVMSQILFNRYERGQGYGFNYTHATLNFPLSVIGEAYGAHVLSRFYEMFNMMELKGKDRRKQIG